MPTISTFRLESEQVAPLATEIAKDNDIGMFRVARYGIAVANACAAAREAADLITVSNNDHAIAQVIYDIEQGNIKF